MPKSIAPYVLDVILSVVMMLYRGQTRLVALLVIVLLIGSVFLWNHVARVEALTDMARLGLIGASTIALAAISLLKLSPDERATLFGPRAKHRLATQQNTVESVTNLASKQNSTAVINPHLRLFLRLAIPWLVLLALFVLARQFLVTHNEWLGMLVVAGLIGGGLQFLLLTTEQRARFKERRRSSK